MAVQIDVNAGKLVLKMRGSDGSDISETLGYVKTNLATGLSSTLNAAVAGDIDLFTSDLVDTLTNSTKVKTTVQYDVDISDDGN